MSTENRMNASVFRDIWTKFKIQSCTSRRRVQFENFKNITKDHILRNALAFILFFVCNILNIIIKESIFGTYHSVKNYNFLSRSSCSYSSSLGLNFLSFTHFSQTFNHVCVDLVVFLFFCIQFQLVNNYFVGRSKPAFSHFAFCV